MFFVFLLPSARPAWSIKAHLFHPLKEALKMDLWNALVRVHNLMKTRENVFAEEQLWMLLDQF